MRKIKYLTIILILITSLTGCSSSQNEALKTNGTIANKKVIETDVPSNWKVYNFIEYGYKVAYPQNYDIELSGGHSPVANQELGMRLSLSSKDSQLGLDIDSIDKVNYENMYQNVDSYIRYKHLDIKFDEDIIINDKHNNIYKLVSDDYYFLFFENGRYIFQISSSSKEILKKIMPTFSFT